MLACNLPKTFQQTSKYTFLPQISVPSAALQASKASFLCLQCKSLGQRQILYCQKVEDCTGNRFIWRNATKKIITRVKETSHVFFLANASLRWLTISENDKNKQLTLLRQRKLALTAINKLFCIIKSFETLKNFKTSCVSYVVRPRSVNFCQNLLNLSHETVPLSNEMPILQIIIN